MTKKNNSAVEDCPVARALEVVGDWWSLLLIRDAMTGLRRFGEFAESLGIAKNILTDRLKKLVAYDILTTVPASDGSAYSEYVLTEKGWGLFYILVALRQWSEQWVACEGDFPELLVDAKNGEPVGPLELHARDGRVLGLGDVRLVHREPQTTPIHTAR